MGLLIGLMMLNLEEYFVLPLSTVRHRRWTDCRSVAHGRASLGGAFVGWGIGVLLTRHVDAILPVGPLCGFVVGLIAGPSLLAAVRRWKRK